MKFHLNVFARGGCDILEIKFVVYEKVCVSSNKQHESHNFQAHHSYFSNVRKLT